MKRQRPDEDKNCNNYTDNSITNPYSFMGILVSYKRYIDEIIEKSNGDNKKAIDAIKKLKEELLTKKAHKIGDDIREKILIYLKEKIAELKSTSLNKSQSLKNN